MPLNKNILKAELSKFTDSSYSGFTGFPKTPLEVGEKWANAIDIYAGVNVVPFSTTATAAKTAIKTAFAGITTPNLAEAQIVAGFTAYASALALGMAGFASVPPPLALDLKPVSVLGFGGANSSTCLDLAVTIIETWFKTGVATPLPSGTPINWN